MITKHRSVFTVPPRSARLCMRRVETGSFKALFSTIFQSRSEWPFGVNASQVSHVCYLCAISCSLHFVFTITAQPNRKPPEEFVYVQCHTLPQELYDASSDGRLGCKPKEAGMQTSSSSCCFSCKMLTKPFSSTIFVQPLLAILRGHSSQYTSS